VDQLDRLGNELWGQERTADAIEILKLNVEAFPERASAHSSLAEAYMEAGDKEQAIRSFAKVLELDPLNRSAVEKLNQLINWWD
jgi:tetratricopeptide (TPR) repeat protein